MHLACAESQIKVVEYFLSLEGVVLDSPDRWGATPMDDAKNSQNEQVILMMERKKNEILARGKARVRWKKIQELMVVDKKK